MIIIRHRINSVQELRLIPKHQGVEIDLRLSANGIYLQHDAKSEGELFKEWVKEYSHKIIILNVKEDGLENQILEILKDNQIENFFFLDQPAPSLFRSAAKGTPIAYRTSDLEGIPFITNAESNWLWIDSFSGDWSHLESAILFAEQAALKTCLVSPELQGRSNILEIQEIIRTLLKMNSQLTAVCTKVQANWESLN